MKLPASESVRPIVTQRSKDVVKAYNVGGFAPCAWEFGVFFSCYEAGASISVRKTYSETGSRKPR